MEEQEADVRKREVFWKTRLQPFSYGLASVWTALSFQHSLTAGLSACAAAFTIMLGWTLLDGSALHQLGLLLLFAALCYSLVVFGLSSQALKLAELPTDEGAVLTTICGHLACLESLLLAGTTAAAALRTSRPVWFYVSGMVIVFVMGQVGHWVSFTTLLWIVGTTTLMLPAALSRDWVAIPTPKAVGRALHLLSIYVQAAVTQLSSHPSLSPSPSPSP